MFFESFVGKSEVVMETWILDNKLFSSLLLSFIQTYIIHNIVLNTTRLIRKFWSRVNYWKESEMTSAKTHNISRKAINETSENLLSKKVHCNLKLLNLFNLVLVFFPKNYTKLSTLLFFVNLSQQIRNRNTTELLQKTD